MKSSRFLPQRRDGSVLLTAVIFMFAIGAAVASYVALSLHSLRSSDRSYFYNYATNLAEAGLERAMYLLNTKDGLGWVDASTATPHLPETSVAVTGERGATASYRVWITGANGPTPTIVAEGRVTPAQGAPVRKQIEVKLGKSSRYALGVVARKGIDLNGKNVTINSYSSDQTFAATGSYQYSPAHANYNGTVATTFIADVDATIDIGTASIHGSVTTSDIKNLNVTKGEIRSGPGAIANPHPQNPNVDLDQITQDFVEDVQPQVLSPSGDSVPSGSSVTLTSGTYNFAGTWNNRSAVIDGDVTLHIQGEFKMAGNSKITIAEGSSLTLVLYGDAQITGNAFLNQTHQPQNLQIIGAVQNPSDTKLRSFKVTGNGGITGILDLPNYNVHLGGGGNDTTDVSGALIAHSIKMGGKFQFHYDEDLANLKGEGKLRVASWRELKAPEFKGES
jgi:hypothetical protein